MGRNAGCESYSIEGNKADTADVVAIYLAVDMVNDYNTFEANMFCFDIDANGINLLTEIYWKINEITYRIEADENGPVKLNITAEAKKKEELAREYGVEGYLERTEADFFYLFNSLSSKIENYSILPTGHEDY